MLDTFGDGRLLNIFIRIPTLGVEQMPIDINEGFGELINKVANRMTLRL